jgi:hypothetical protein
MAPGVLANYNLLDSLPENLITMLISLRYILVCTQLFESSGPGASPLPPRINSLTAIAMAPAIAQVAHFPTTNGALSSPAQRRPWRPIGP